MDNAAWRGIAIEILVASCVSSTLPYSANADEIQDGAAEYRARCVSSHGESGAGGGPVASALRTRPSDLRLLAKSNGGVFPEKVLETVIDGPRTIRAHGNVEMPVLGRELSHSAMDEEAARQISAIVEYL